MVDPNLRRISDALPDRESARKAFCRMQKVERENLRLSQVHENCNGDE